MTAQEKTKVAFLGPVASYTHQAALQCLSTDEYEHIPATTIADVFEAVQSGSTSLGVIPFENSTNGAVIPSLELLADRKNLYPSLHITSETYLSIHHFLLGRPPPSTATSTLSPSTSGQSTPTPSVPSPLAPRAKPLVSLKHIRQIYTHPQAYGQCEVFLGAYLKGVERREESSTSRSAEIVRGDTSGTSVAIASSLAASTSGLDILAECIEDNADNTTRFLILQSGPPSPSQISGPTKSLISFEVTHGEPGALADVLNCFRKEGLNLTSINSRPAKSFQYVFFVEFEGCRVRDPEGRVERALRELERFTLRWRWLGSFDDQLRR